MFKQLYNDFIELFLNDIFLDIVDVVSGTLFIWLPILLVIILWNLWMRYIQKKFILSQDYVLLEIKLPSEIKKTPLAMEIVLNGIHIGPGEQTWIKRYIKGSVRPWWSLEMVSIEGEIHFFIWTRKFIKNMVESQIYAQYPEVEIHEVEDYSRFVDFEVGKTALWGCDFKLKREDAYPIKTYIDYGLDDESIKEEHKIDPLTSIMEFLGSIGKGEQIWFQILIRQTKTERRKSGLFSKKVGWKDEAEELVKKLREKTVPNLGGEFPGFPNPTKGERDAMDSIERSISKHGFDCGIRGIYFSDADKFDAINIFGLLNSFKQFSSNTLNGFSPTRWLIPFNYPWQDFRDIRKNRKRKRIMDAYRKRSWFHQPYKTSSYVLNTEELATIFHFPGAVAQVPSISRITSRRGDAPPNLPK